MPTRKKSIVRTPGRKLRKKPIEQQDVVAEFIARHNRRPKKSELTRARLLDAAAHTFKEKGYALTRLTDIAKRAHAQTSSIYYYFESREAIVVEVLRIANDRTLQRVNDFLAELPLDATVEDRLTAAIRGHYDIVLSQDPYTMAHMRIFDQVPPNIKKQFLGVLDETTAIWRQLLLEGQASGAIRADIDLSVTRQLLLGMMNWSIEWFRPGRLSVEDIAQQTATILFDGICTR
ncbi:TetR family transcriptional regulator [Castellaniella sp.]|uniref:TetR family transcriptional regulator n=1 Tax=Castellaniella sp. TaxID=1955812 RepID=UPI00355FDE6A